MPTCHPNPVTPKLNASERIGGRLAPARPPAMGAHAHLAAIHVLKSKLRMSDDDYRALLLHLTGRSSSKDCTLAQRRQVRLHLQKLVRLSGTDRPRAVPRRGRPVTDLSEQASKVRALWLFLHELGQVRDPSEAALLAYVKRTLRTDALEWTHGQYWKLIESLKNWAMRALPGVVQLRRERLRGVALPQELAARMRHAEVDLADGVARDLKSLFDRHWAVYALQREALALREREQ